MGVLWVMGVLANGGCCGCGVWAMGGAVVMGGAVGVVWVMGGAVCGCGGNLCVGCWVPRWQWVPVGGGSLSDSPHPQ